MAVTWLGSLYVLLPLSVVLMGFMVYQKKLGAAGLLGVGFGGAALLTYLAKILVSRPRPDLFPPLIPMPGDFSFPSAHTSQITAFALCLILITCRGYGSPGCWLAVIMGTVIIGAVSYSRLYLQVHYLSDVLAGALLAIVWVTAIRFLLERIYPAAFP